MSSRQL